MAKFFSAASLGTVSRWKYRHFCVTLMSLEHSVGSVDRSLPAKNQLGPWSRFDKMQANNSKQKGNTVSKKKAGLENKLENRA